SLEIIWLPRFILRKPHPIDEIIRVSVEVTQMSHRLAVRIFDATFGVPGTFGLHKRVTDIARPLVEVQVGKRRYALARTGVGHQFPPLAKLVSQIDSRKNLPAVIRIVIDVGTSAEQ